jgi:hypothetical protein
MTAADDLMPWTPFIEMLMADGYDDDEIVDELRRSSTRPPGSGMSLHTERMFRAGLPVLRLENGIAARPVGSTSGTVATDNLDRYARKALELREPDGSWPTQPVLAEALGVSDRQVRKLGWEKIKSRAGQLERR